MNGDPKKELLRLNLEHYRRNRLIEGVASDIEMESSASESLGTEDSEESSSLHQAMEEAKHLAMMRIERQVDLLFNEGVHDLIRFRYC